MDLKFGILRIIADTACVTPLRPFMAEISSPYSLLSDYASCNVSASLVCPIFARQI